MQVPLFAPISYDGIIRQYYVKCPCCSTENYVWHWPDRTYKMRMGEEKYEEQRKQNENHRHLWEIV